MSCIVATDLSKQYFRSISYLSSLLDDTTQHTLDYILSVNDNHIGVLCSKLLLYNLFQWVQCIRFHSTVAKFTENSCL